MRPVRWALLGNRVVPGCRLSLRPWDDVVRWGAGVFETIGCQDGLPLLFPAHRDRLAGAVADLGWPGASLPDSPAVERLLRRVGLEAGPAALRLVAFPRRGWTSVAGWAESYRVPRRLRRVGAWLEPVTFPSGLLTGTKATSYLAFRVASGHVRKEGADAALLVERDGTVREADHANLFVRRGRDVVTPPAPCRCLPGIMRAWCLEVLPRLGWSVREEEFGLATVPEWDEAWLTSSLAGVVPVQGVAGQRLRGCREVVETLFSEAIPAPGSW